MVVYNIYDGEGRVAGVCVPNEESLTNEDLCDFLETGLHDKSDGIVNVQYSQPSSPGEPLRETDMELGEFEHAARNNEPLVVPEPAGNLVRVVWKSNQPQLASRPVLFDALNDLENQLYDF